MENYIDPESPHDVALIDHRDLRHGQPACWIRIPRSTWLANGRMVSENAGDAGRRNRTGGAPAPVVTEYR